MRVQSCLALSAALLAGGSAFATVYDVSPAGTEGYTAKNLILTAKNAATQKGDVIRLAPGTYAYDSNSGDGGLTISLA